MPESLFLFGTEISLYYLFWLLGNLFGVFIGLLLAKNYGLTYSKVVVYICVAFVLDFLLIGVTSWAFGGGKIQGFNLVRIYAFLPLLYWALSRLFKESYANYSDLLAAAGMCGIGVMRMGCVFTGCCQGYPSQWGIYSNAAQTVCFPVQIIEIAVCLIIGAILVIMAKKKIQQGRLLCWMMILFGSTRFVLEFYRDNQKLWLNISELAVHAFVTFAVGLILLIIITSRDYRRTNEKD